ncbi:hypothetical protein L1049_024345 [Liquidambar formosana]|uniref:Uncharacterized protein n=1 Tax=Liquidambar formosana TaxID=63359 RepID=A0AAP0WYF9_LIQFO
MIHTIRSVRTQLPPTLLSSSPLPSRIGRRTSSVRFPQAKVEPKKPVEEPDNMDKANNQNQKTGDVMSHSFGEGYATRSDEEGFGGIYRGNQLLRKPQGENVIDENHPEYDKSQGSEMKEKEKGRHQTNAAA